MKDKQYNKYSTGSRNMLLQSNIVVETQSNTCVMQIIIGFLHVFNNIGAIPAINQEQI